MHISPPTTTTTPVFLLLLLSLLLSLTTSQPDPPIFRYEIFPRTTPTNPLQRRIFEFIPDPSTDWPMSTWFLIEHLSSSDMSVATVDISEWTNSRALFSRNTVMPGGYNYSTYYKGPIYVRISAWKVADNSDISNCVGMFDPETPTIIYWDFRFSALDFDLQMRSGEGSVPGELFIDPIPKTPLDAELMQQVRVMLFQAITTADLEGEGIVDYDIGGCEVNKVTDSLSFHHVFWEAPKIWYWYMRPYSGWGWRHTGEGLPTSKYWHFAIRCCSETTGCPAVDPLWGSLPVFTLDPCIPGDMQLPILKRDVAIVEGTPLFLPRKIDPDFVLVETPPQIRIGESVNTEEQFDSVRFYSLTLRDDLTPVHAGYVTYQLEKRGSGDWWSSFPMIFEFGEGVILGEKYSIFLQVNSGGAWQELVVTPHQMPENPTGPPRRLRVGYTWSNLYYYQSLKYYADLGFNLVPGTGYISTDYASSKEYYLPSFRESEWPAQSGYDHLLYNPEVSLFHYTSPSLGLVKLHDVLFRDTVVDAWLPLTVPNRALELQKWDNAVRYHAATGNSDMAYDGYFYQSHLDQFSTYVNWTRPQTINFDIEGWSSAASILPTVSQSDNFESRRLPAEDDETLYRRVIDEFMGDIMGVIRNYVPDCEVTWYATRCYGHPPGYGYQLGTWDQFDRAGFICQPELYIPHKHPELLAQYMRSNKHGCCCRHCGDQSWTTPDQANKIHMIPMPTPGCYGEMSTDSTLDWLIQLFTNGATGFMIYPQTYTDDLYDTIHIAEVMRVFAKPEIEDMIMDGELVYQNIRDMSSNLVVGAIQLDEDILLGISHLWTSPLGPEGVFCIDYASSQFEVTNLREEESIYVTNVWSNPSNPSIRYDRKRRAICFTYEEPSPNLPDILLVSSIKTRVGASIATGLVLGVVAAAAAIVAIVLILATLCCSKKKVDSGLKAGETEEN